MYKLQPSKSVQPQVTIGPPAKRQWRFGSGPIVARDSNCKSNESNNVYYSKTCLKRPLKNMIKNLFSRPVIAKCRSKVLQNAPKEHSAILLTFIIKLPFIFKTFVLSIFEWPLKIWFTVIVCNRLRRHDHILFKATHGKVMLKENNAFYQ